MSKKSKSSTIAIPPGIVFLTRNLSTIASPSIIVYTLTKLLTYDQLIPFISSLTSSTRVTPTLRFVESLQKSLRNAGLSRPWALYLIYAVALPVSLWLKITTRDLKDQWEAKKRGAILPPKIKDWTIGNLNNMKRGLKSFKTGYPGDIFKEMSEEYGNIFNFRILFQNRFFTIEPEHYKAILATQFDNFEKGPEFQDYLRTLLGTGVFNSDGEMWKFHRAMTRPFFSKDRISHFDIFERHAIDALSQLKKRLNEGYAVDIQDLASRFTMDSATEFLFAHDVRSLEAGIPYPFSSPLAAATEVSRAQHPANKFAKAFDEAQRLSALRSRRGYLWPLSEFWKDKVEEQMVVVRSFIEPIIKEALRKKKDRALIEVGNDKAGGEIKEVEEGESLLEHLVKLTDDEDVLRDETLNILLAGRDTTTNSITFATYMLAENPHVLKKLRQEILDKVGGRRPTFDDMRDLKYLRAVINETIRLYPAVPFNVRTSNKPVLLPNKNGLPFYIPAQCRMPYGVFWTHRRKDLWGPDADVFDPERFIDERVKKYLTPNPFIFLPFNAGPRICLGQQFAYHETSYFLIRLLQQFQSISLDLSAQPEWAAPPKEWKTHGVGTQKTDKIKMKSYLTMSVVGGVWVGMEEANDCVVEF